MLHAFDMGSSTEVSRPSPPTSIFVPGNTAPNVITYHHHPQHAPPSMPHYNSKGEFIKVTYNQPPVRACPPSDPLHLYLPANDTRMCWRYGCAATIPPNIPGMMCEKCLKAGYTSDDSGHGRPSQSLPTLLNVTRPGSWSALTKPLVDKGKGREVLHGSIPSLHRLKGPVFQPPKRAPRNDTNVGTSLEKIFDLVDAKRFAVPGRNELPHTGFSNSAKPPSVKKLREASPPHSRIPNSPLGDSGLVPRYSCETKGCKNAVPIDAKWPRCTSCSLKRWKEKLQPNHNQVESLPKSEGRAFSKKRKAEAIMETVDAIDKEENYTPGWNRDLTEHSLSGKEDGNDKGSPKVDHDEMRVKSRITIRIPARQSGSKSSLPPNPWTGTTRICVRRTCNTALPQSYQWKVCEPCRLHSRQYKRKRLALTSGTTSSLSLCQGVEEINDAASLAPLPFQLTPSSQITTSPPGYRICKLKQCDNPIPPLEKYRFKICQSCRDHAGFVNHSGGKKRDDGGEVRPIDRMSNKRKRERSMSCESEEGVEQHCHVSSSPPPAATGASEAPVVLSSAAKLISAMKAPANTKEPSDVIESPTTLTPDAFAISSPTSSFHTSRSPPTSPFIPTSSTAIVALPPIATPLKETRPLFTRDPISSAHTLTPKSKAARTPKSNKRSIHSPSKYKSQSKAVAKALPLRISTPTPSYPSYQHLTPLVQAFKTYLDGFLETLRWRARAKALVEPVHLREKSAQDDNNSANNSSDTMYSAQRPTGAKLNPSGSTTNSVTVAFSFEGEYSIISTPEEKGGSGTQETYKRVGSVVKDIERATGLTFSSTSSWVINTGGVIVRFRCEHDVLYSASTSPQHSTPSDGSIDRKTPSFPTIHQPSSLDSTSKSTAGHTSRTKAMVGELEVAVLPDHSHRFFVGRRTIVRFRLIE